MIDKPDNSTSNGQTIIAVTVTYGNRWSHLEKVIAGVFQQELVNSLVIVDNASSYNLQERISFLSQPKQDKIIVLSQSENRGSAGGFFIGLKKAYELQADFVYLLDDDNCPEENAVSILYQEWQSLAQIESVALLSFRYRNLPTLQRAAQGLEVRYFRDKPNSFLGFSLWDSLAKRFRKTTNTSPSSALLPRVEVKQAPYGGLFLPKATISKIGFPNEQLYLYADDTEYSNRIIQQGGHIWMVTASKLRDLEVSWWSDAAALNNKWREPLLEEGGFKAYYSTRNLTWFLWRNHTPNPILFFINAAIYLVYLFCIALVSKKMKSFFIVFIAVKDGLLGRLGKNPRIEQGK